MKYRRLDNNDYVFGSGKSDFIKDDEAFAQAVKTKCLLYQGEWWEDLSEGLPFYQQIAGQFIRNDEDKGVVSQLYLDRISEIPDFLTIVSFEDDFDNETREYSLTANVQTTYGLQQVEVV